MPGCRVPRGALHASRHHGSPAAPACLQAHRGTVKAALNWLLRHWNGGTEQRCKETYIYAADGGTSGDTALATVMLMAQNVCGKCELQHTVQSGSWFSRGTSNCNSGADQIATPAASLTLCSLRPHQPRKQTKQTRAVLSRTWVCCCNVQQCRGDALVKFLQALPSPRNSAGHTTALHDCPGLRLCCWCCFVSEALQEPKVALTEAWVGCHLWFEICYNMQAAGDLVLGYRQLMR